MASIVPGYEYDIFISYRQKDNKHDGWVTEFVDHLRGELESIFKEDISTYFDINPHDGLLQTHDVNESLKEKLKCLIFIPIISRTYCDPKSFAWEHEFKAFVDLASRDRFGLKIKLPNGNIANRLIPVQIHDLHHEDKSLVEQEIGGVLRAIEFIYKEPGVNKPLTSDDNEKKNLNGTKYRIQINKVANAIDEIIASLKGIETNSMERKMHNAQSQSYELEDRKPGQKSGEGFISRKSKRWVSGVLSVLLFFAAVFIILKVTENSKRSDEVTNNEKSIAVLPFVNMNNDPDQDYISDGMMQEILNHLFKIGGLQIPSGNSSMRFKGTKLSVREIAQELDVLYVLEGNVTRSGDNVRVMVRLINGKNERIIWNENYERTMTAPSLFEIQSDVAQRVADKMNVVINPEVRQRIEARPTSNTEAYTLYLSARNFPLSFNQARQVLVRAIDLDPKYADAYALLGIYWIHQGGHDGDIQRQQVLGNAESLIRKSLQLDQNSFLAHLGNGILRLYYYWDFESIEKEFQICQKLSPSNSDLADGFSEYLLAAGKVNESFILIKKALDQNKNSVINWIDLALTYYFDGQQEKAIETIETTRHLFPEFDSLNQIVFTNSMRLLVYTEKYDEAIELFEKSADNVQINDLIPIYLGFMGIAYFKTGNKSKSELFLDELIKRSNKSSIGSPAFYAAAIYSAMGENNNAFSRLEKAYTDHEVEMYWLKVDPPFTPLHGDPQFEKLLKKIGLI